MPEPTFRREAFVETYLTAHHADIASIMQYGLSLWGNSVSLQIYKVYKAFILQTKCVRAIRNAEFSDHTKPLLQELKVLTLPCLYIKELAVFVKQHSSMYATRT